MTRLHAVPQDGTPDGARGGTPYRLVVVSAGMSEQSTSTLLAGMLRDATLEAHDGALADAEVHEVQLRPLAHALTDALLTGFATGELREALDAVERADAVIAVTPVHSASYSALFKAFFDVLDRGALDGTPVLAAATAGTARHSLVLDHALRPLLGYLKAVVVPTGVFAAAEDWGSGEQVAAAALRRRVARAAGELVALVTARPREATVDAFDRDIAAMGSFEDLLNGGG